MLRACKKPYVAFSCGKDSTVLADMILRISPGTPLRFVSSGETRLIHNVDDVIDYFRSTYYAEIEEINYDRFFSGGWQGKNYDEVRASAHGDIKSLNRNTSFDGVFMGLRKEESRKRKISLSLCQSEELPWNMYKYADREFYRMCPLANWKTEDVGAYIVEHDIPVLNWYNSFGFDARTTRGVAPSRMSAPEA